VTVEGKDGLPRVKIYMGTEPAGDALDDNSYEEDHYRSHDALHLAHAAVLDWSRASDGKALISGGRFAETKEQIGGYCLIDCMKWRTHLSVETATPSRGALDAFPIVPGGQEGRVVSNKGCDRHTASWRG
jgi:hypothetical protein